MKSATLAGNVRFVTSFSGPDNGEDSGLWVVWNAAINTLIN